jgi:hypothetical protein
MVSFFEATQRNSIRDAVRSSRVKFPQPKTVRLSKPGWVVVGERVVYQNYSSDNLDLLYWDSLFRGTMEPTIMKLEQRRIGHMKQKSEKTGESQLNDMYFFAVGIEYDNIAGQNRSTFRWYMLTLEA